MGKKQTKMEDNSDCENTYDDRNITPPCAFRQIAQNTTILFSILLYIHSQ